MTYEGPIWEGVYRTFADVPVTGQGFDGDLWTRNSLKKIEELRGEVEEDAPLPPASNHRECLLPLLAALDYEKKGTVRILDFGGGIGFAYYQTIRGLTRTEGVEYHIVERESVCKAGREYFRTTEPHPQFFTELPKSENRYDIVHLGSVIHYVEKWQQLLSQLCALSRQYLLLVDVTAGSIPTFATAQYYYGSKIPVWFFNIEEILHTVRSFGYELIFKSTHQPFISRSAQELPMQNFEEKHRLKRACNLLFNMNRKRYY